ncbi:ASCH domain-containing protein [Salmonella enterica]
MSLKLESLQQHYPQAHVWHFGDTPELADELAHLVVCGEKTGTCGSYSSFLTLERKILPGDYHIVLDGKGEPACVIRTVAMKLLRFNEITEYEARLEGEGDKSLSYWRDAHRAFFEREGTFAPDMELLFEEFILVESR